MRMEYYYKTKAFLLSLINSVAFIILFSSCNSGSETNDNEQISSIVDSTFKEIDVTEKEDSINLEVENYSYQTINNHEAGWGYQILKGDKVYINQPHIPAVQGVNGFATEEKARITAEFALYKISNGIMPPTLSKLELDSLGVLGDIE